MNRGTNTSPVQTLDEQEKEITTMTTGQKAAITQAEIQEETLPLESLQTEDISVKQADPKPGQDPTTVQAQNMEKKEVPDAKDTSNMQVQDGNADSQVNGEQPDPDIPHDQTLRALQDDNYQTAMMMMRRMIQYNFVIQSSNHSCQEVSEYPLQRKVA